MKRNIRVYEILDSGNFLYDKLRTMTKISASTFSKAQSLLSWGATARYRNSTLKMSVSMAKYL